jgi:amino-acid N-acetyltransferase
MPESPASFIRWFRGSAPYIHAHRGNTFVVYFPGEAVADARFPSLIHDFALLNSLGVKLVLVHGIRAQIDSRLARRGLAARYHGGFRVTDGEALECVKEAAGTVRVEIEALMSMGLANSPMAGARIRVASGNFVAAKPVGVRDGVDFQHTGEVRRVDAAGIRASLSQGDVVLLSSVGYSPTGEIFNLRSEEVATAAAIALQADKLLLLGEAACCPQGNGELLRQLTTTEAEQLLAGGNGLDADVASHLRAAAKASAAGVERVHLLDRQVDGAVLLELFTRDGIGTLVSRTPFEALRPAGVHDVPGILDILVPLERKGVLVPRSRERLESAIGDYTVIERDGLIIGCVAFHPYAEAAMVELACLALHPDYQGDGRGERLLAHVEARVRAAGYARLFALTTQTAHWFRERGFEPAEVGDLPEARRANYNPARNSKVLVKILERLGT